MFEYGKFERTRHMYVNIYTADNKLQDLGLANSLYLPNLTKLIASIIILIQFNQILMIMASIKYYKEESNYNQ